MTGDGHNPAWRDLPPNRRADLARRMAVYAAMVEGMDRNIGRLVATLKEHGELDNTLLVFLSDNGACAEWEPFGFDLKPTAPEELRPGHGINGYTPGRPNHLHTGKELATMGGPGSLFSYGSAWANLSNTPLWLYKHYAHEGGIRTPMIVHWPARIREGGGIRSRLSHLMDLMPTCVEVSGASYPKTHRNHKILPMEGRSLLPAIDGKPEGKRTLVFEHERNAALIEGEWKLVGKKVISKDRVIREGEWSLYHLASDPCEQDDQISSQAERATRMMDILEKEARRTLILPAP